MSTPASALSARGFAVLTHARDDRGRESGPVTRQRHRGFSERRLIAAARRGEEAAQEELFHRHWLPMYRAAYLITQDTAAAEDVAQEAFMAAIAALDRFDLRRPLGPWLHRIAVNRAIDLFRARQLRQEVARDTMEEETSDESPREHMPPLTDQMVAALGVLPIDQRAVIVMRYVLDRTPGEIARTLELPRGTVNSRLRRGLDRVAESLGGER
jgi:RNA polymerase sigma-70 factor, ECF subfamily